VVLGVGKKLLKLHFVAKYYIFLRFRVGDGSNIFHVALLLSFRWCYWINLTYELLMMREAVLRPNCIVFCIEGSGFGLMLGHIFLFIFKIHCTRWFLKHRIEPFR